MKIKLVDTNIEGIDIVKNALSVCRNKECTDKTIEHCLEATPVPHLSALEFLHFTFQIDGGVSVKTRIQLERHRLYSSMERSTRHINMSDAEFVVPPTAKHPKIFKAFYKLIKKMYDILIDIGESKEDASYILPLGVETRFFLSGNGRVFFEYFTKRLCKKHVQPEHFIFAKEMFKQIVEEYPQFKYAIPCRTCKGCKDEITFKP